MRRRRVAESKKSKDVDVASEAAARSVDQTIFAPGGGGGGGYMRWYLGAYCVVLVGA